MTSHETPTSFVACQSVVASDLPGGAALPDMRANKYFSLNIVGADVWKHIQTPTSLQSLVVIISDKFDVALDDCERDVSALMSALVAAGLVEVASVKAVEAVG
jgi:hypothetical protein